MTAFSERFDLDRIGEINLLLRNLEFQKSSVLAAKRQVLEMANRIPQRPVPDDYIRLSTELGLIKIEDDTIRLTMLGQQVRDNIDISKVHKLSESQAELLEPEILLHPVLGTYIKASVNRMELWADGIRRFHVSTGQEINSEETSGFYLLQSLHMMDVLPNPNGQRFLTLKTEASSKLLESEFDIHGTTESELWETLDRQRIRARTAEELVVKYEKERLRALGNPELSSLVKRVSEYDVSAGYDVRSFDPGTGEIFIEVKSSINSRLRFYWSPNEKKIAEEKADHYWIYFIPRIREYTRRLEELIAISDPISKIGASLTELPSNFEVTMSGSSNVEFQWMTGPTHVSTIR